MNEAADGARRLERMGEIVGIDVQLGVEVAASGSRAVSSAATVRGGRRRQPLASYRAVSSASSASGVSASSCFSWPAGPARCRAGWTRTRIRQGHR